MTTERNNISKKQNKLVSVLSLGFLVLFVAMSFINIDVVTKLVNLSFSFSVKYFGAVWQILLVGTFFLSIALAFSKYGDVKLGDLDKPEFSTFRWICMIMCTLLAGGGVFWSAAEPMYYFLNVPPSFIGIENATKNAVAPASVSYTHL